MCHFISIFFLRENRQLSPPFSYGARKALIPRRTNPVQSPRPAAFLSAVWLGLPGGDEVISRENEIIDQYALHVSCFILTQQNTQQTPPPCQKDKRFYIKVTMREAVLLFIKIYFIVCCSHVGVLGAMADIARNSLWEGG